MLAVVACVACGGHEPARPELPRAVERLYAYDRHEPLRLRDRGVINPTYRIKVHDIDYASPRGGRVPAFLVVPPEKGRLPAVIFMHGSGGTRWEFLLEAVRLAERGVVAITITSPFERSPQRVLPQPRELRHDRARFAQEVVDLRRVVDLLAGRSDVDAKRIGFVGFSRGAESGAILAGVEARIAGFDLISGAGSLSSRNFVPPLRPPLTKSTRGLLESFRPSRFIRLSRAPVYLQFGRYDEEIERSRQLELSRATPEPKTVRWYYAGHALGRQAELDTYAWLGRTLGIARAK
jgi:dienelactone hydrolase